MLSREIWKLYGLTCLSTGLASVIEIELATNQFFKKTDDIAVKNSQDFEWFNDLAEIGSWDLDLGKLGANILEYTWKTDKIGERPFLKTRTDWAGVTRPPMKYYGSKSSRVKVKKQQETTSVLHWPEDRPWASFFPCSNFTSRCELRGFQVAIQVLSFHLFFYEVAHERALASSRIFYKSEHN